MNTDGTQAAVRAEGLVRKLSNGAHTVTILDGASVEIAQGTSAAILGPSGSGKTTLLSLLAGLDAPDAGQVWLDGIEITALDEEHRARLRAGRVGFVFQSFQLLPALTALENVMLAAEIAGLADAAAQARESLAQVGLADRAGHLPHQLSGGEQQRVAIARAFVASPRVLFADEPTGNLDLATGAQIIDLLFALNRAHGTTLVLVTHDAELARRCALRLQLRDGRLHRDGSA